LRGIIPFHVLEWVIFFSSFEKIFCIMDYHLDNRYMHEALRGGVMVPGVIKLMEEEGKQGDQNPLLL